MNLHCLFCMLVALAIKVFALMDFLGGQSEELLFPDTISQFYEVEIPSDQGLWSMAPGSSDYTELEMNTEFSPFIDEFWLDPTENSIHPPQLDIDWGLVEFSTTSDSSALAGCSNFGNSFLPTPIGKSRWKREAWCEVPDRTSSPHTLSIPTAEDLDVDLREAILNQNPGLRVVLERSQDNENDNTVCIILTEGRLPFGICSSVTVIDGFYRYTMTFPWNAVYSVTIWDLINVTPGMIPIKNQPPL